jgi:transposase-like protein
VGDKWHLDEVVLKIAGVKHWLWRAVDQTCRCGTYPQIVEAVKLAARKLRIG